MMRTGRLFLIVGLGCLVASIGCSSEEEVAEPSRAPDAGRRFVEHEKADEVQDEAPPPRERAQREVPTAAPTDSAKRVLPEARSGESIESVGQ